jgi:hypothetical protein
MSSLNYDDNLKSAKWEKMTGSNGKMISSNNFITMCVTKDNSVFDLVCNEWKQCPKLKLTHISVGYDGTIVGIDTDKHLVLIEGNHYSNYIQTVFHDRQKWICVACWKKNYVVGIIENQSIYKGRIDGYFEEVGGKLVQVSVGIDRTLYGRNKDENLYRMDANKTNWDQLPGKGVYMGCYDKAHACHVNSDDKIYMLRGDKDWDEDTAGKCVWLQMCKDRYYCVNRAGEFFKKQ